jgi:hypothetical protein
MHDEFEYKQRASDGSVEREAAALEIGEPMFPASGKAERVLQTAFVHTVGHMLARKNLHYVILEGSGLDVSVFIDTREGGRFRQFELKTFTNRSGRTGLSEGHLRLLCDKTDREICVVDNFVRWKTLGILLTRRRCTPMAATIRARSQMPRASGKMRNTIGYGESRLIPNLIRLRVPTRFLSTDRLKTHCNRAR